MKKFVSLLLCAILMVSLVACGGAPAETTAPNAFTPAVDGDVLGEGDRSFPLTIVDKDGNTINVTIKTNEEMVGPALQNTGLVEGTVGEYGLYIEAVNGIEAIYEEDGSYWAFYINDEYALTSVDSTAIEDGASYMLKVEQG